MRIYSSIYKYTYKFIYIFICRYIYKCMYIFTIWVSLLAKIPADPYICFSIICTTRSGSGTD
jgi:hypothetical protein